MKTYRAECIYPENPEAMNLVNIDDVTDYFFANADDFQEGEFVTEDQFYLKDCSYTNDQGCGTAPFAFKGERKNFQKEPTTFLTETLKEQLRFLVDETVMGAINEDLSFESDQEEDYLIFHKEAISFVIDYLGEKLKHLD